MSEKSEFLRGRGVLKFNRSVYQSLTMISQFGINMLVPVCVCSFLGHFLDKKLGTSYLVIILFFVGAVAGFRNIYRFAMQISKKASSSEAYLHTGRHKRQKLGENKKEAENERNNNKNE